MEGAYANSTTRAYRVNFENFIKHREKLNENPPSATPETIFYISRVLFKMVEVLQALEESWQT